MERVTHTEKPHCHSCAPAEPVRYTVREFLPLIIPLFAVALYATAQNPFAEGFVLHLWMLDFMGAFFVVFGLMKAVSLRTFAASYKTYDLLAQRIPGWAYAYPFVELGVGALYLSRMYIPVANMVTLVVMTLSALSVYGKLKRHERTVCACVGGYFSVPLTRVTFVEYAGMALMALEMMRHY